MRVVRAAGLQLELAFPVVVNIASAVGGREGTAASTPHALGTSGLDGNGIQTRLLLNGTAPVRYCAAAATPGWRRWRKEFFIGMNEVV